jgi:hypothetical protein
VQTLRTQAFAVLAVHKLIQCTHILQCHYDRARELIHTVLTCTDLICACTVQGDWDVSASLWSSNATESNGSASNGSASNGSSSAGTDATAAADIDAAAAAAAATANSSSGEWVSRELRYISQDRCYLLCALSELRWWALTLR